MDENKMAPEMENDNLGAIKISEEVVAILADKAVREVEGIAELSGNFVQSFAAAFGKKAGTKGIGVDIKDGNCIISLHTIVKYGVRIPEVAWKAQDAVKNAVESMTGLNVQKVNISIEGVEFNVPQEEEEPVVVDEVDETMEEEPATVVEIKDETSGK